MEDSDMYIIIGCVLGGVVLIAVLVLICCCYKCCRDDDPGTINTDNRKIEEGQVQHVNRSFAEKNQTFKAPVTSHSVPQWNQYDNYTRETIQHSNRSFREKNQTFKFPVPSQSLPQWNQSNNYIRKTEQHSNRSFAEKKQTSKPPDGWKQFKKRHIVSPNDEPNNKAEWYYLIQQRGLDRNRHINTFIIGDADVILKDFRGQNIKNGNCTSSEKYVTFDFKANKMYTEGYRNICVFLEGGYPVHFEKWV